MSHFQLYVIDEDQRSASWSHTNGKRGLTPCLNFPDDKPAVIVLEHPTQTTYMYLSPDGMLEIETDTT